MVTSSSPRKANSPKVECAKPRAVALEGTAAELPKGWKDGMSSVRRCETPAGLERFGFDHPPELGGVIIFSFRETESMRQFISAVKDFMVAEDGPTAVEYAVMLALIIVVCIVVIGQLGTNARATFQTVANSIGGAS
jgi:pilus assembly protein Flp/PilA